MEVRVEEKGQGFCHKIGIEIEIEIGIGIVIGIGYYNTLDTYHGKAIYSQVPSDHLTYQLFN